ncbi:MAG: FAD-dependent oxidoreductase [Planctomycetes bacterium]|nr:FAD-dependent oxidoreductase [Planctomycetota bacterium]
MRPPLPDLDGRQFDVVVIGAGINGCAAAEELAAAGYATLLVDKRDFCSGSSSRSTRLLHCGLRYLASGGSPWAPLVEPHKFVGALAMAKKAMRCRAEFVGYAADRVRRFTFGYPLWRGQVYRPWQVDLAIRVLDALGGDELPLDRGRLSPAEVATHPFYRHLRDQSALLGLNTFTEFQFNWPERIGMDMVLDAERLGAVARNYTPVTRMQRNAEAGWDLTLGDAHDPGATATVSAKLVVNTAGIWIDRVNKLGAERPVRKIFGTKGAHVVFRLPPECDGYGVIGVNREGVEPVYLVPWRHGLHYMAVTETVFEGDEDDIRADDADIQWLLDEFNHLLPSLAKTRADVLWTWAGVRPLGHDPAFPKGKRVREIHDLGDAGMPGVLAMTAGPIMTHRSAGRELRDTVATRLKPSGTPRAPDYTPSPVGKDQSSPAVLNDYDGVRVADLRRFAESEQVCSLTDLLARRAGLVWTTSNAREAARSAAEAVADVLGWDAARIDAEVAGYHEYLDRQHGRPAA